MIRRHFQIILHNFKVVLALGSRGSNDICLHADTHPISVAVRLEQVSGIKVKLCFFININKLIPIN